MKKIFQTTLFVLSFFLISALVFGRVNAASLKFDVPSISVAAGDTFDLQVIVDSGGEEINSIDAYIKFDSSIVSAKSVAEGTFFPTVLNDISNQRIYVAGLVDDPASSKSGSGTVATLTFSALKNGTTTLTYDCDPSVNETSKVVKSDIDATNIIVCSENGSAAVSVTTQAAATPTPAQGEGAAGGEAGAAEGGAGGAGGEEAATGGGGELPQSGTFDNVVKYATPGILLFIIGLAVKLLL